MNDLNKNEFKVLVLTIERKPYWSAYSIDNRKGFHIGIMILRTRKAWTWGIETYPDPRNKVTKKCLSAGPIMFYKTTKH